MARSDAMERAEIAALAAIALAAIAVRVPYLDDPMRYDEAWTYTNVVAQGMRHVLSAYDAPNNHVLHSALVRVSVALFGIHEWAIRLPAFLAGVLLVPATFVAGRVMHGRRAALVASALVAALGELVVFSTNARGYTMMALAFVVLIVIAARQMRAPDARGWVALAVVGALGMHTVPAMLYPLGGVALWLAASWLVGDVAPPRARFLRELAIALVAAALLTTLLYAPILLENGLSSIAGNRYVAPDSREGFLFGLRRLPVWLWRDWMLGVPSWLAIVLTGAAAAGIALHRRVSGRRVPLWLAVLVWSAALLLVTRRVPGVRVWLFLVPLFALVAAAGIALSVDVVARRLRIRADGVVPVIAVALALVIGVHGVRTDAVHHPELGDISTLRDAPAIAAHLETALKAGDRVLTDIPSDAPLEYYLARRGVPRSVLAWSSLRSTSTPRLDGAECLVVVVNTRGGQSLSSVLAENGVVAGDLEERGAPQRFPHGAVVHRACGRA